MKKRDIRFASIPSTEEVAAERERLAYQSRYQRVLRSTIYILVVVAAAAVLLATLFLPVSFSAKNTGSRIVRCRLR